MNGDVTRGSPLGCFTGVLATIPLGFAVVSGYGLWRWFGTPADDRPEGTLGILLGSFIIGLLLFILLSWLSVRILKTTRWKDYDPGNDTSLHH